MKALIVDDDRVLADVLAFTLRREGFEVIQAHDGETALARWAEHQPDLVVLDVNMPRLDGFAVCRQIREVERTESHADTPIILLTVRGEEDDIVHGLGLGADDYITKPFSPRQLVARAQAVLRRAGRATGTDIGGYPGVGALRRVGVLTLDSSRRELHVGEAFCVSEAGRTRHVALGGVDRERLREGLENYRTFRAARRELAAARRRLLALADEMERLRRVPVEDL